MKNSKNIRCLVSFLMLASMIFSTVILSGCQIIIGTGTTNGTDPNHTPVVDPIDDNNRTLYQIYVRSFADSDGDGVGDIRGIIETFDYLNDGDITAGDDLGVQAIWLTPVFYGNSDHKYDAIDFYSIDPEFGTQDDLVELAELCEERNVKLILDLALNHTSTSNNWFKEFKKAHQSGDTSNKYYNYYSWYSSKLNDGYVQVPGQSLWYECWFDVTTEENAGGSMPELNYDNQAVRQEMLNVAKYWMDLGVDGFRFDAVKYIYYNDHTKSSAFYKWYTDELRKEYPDIYLIGECWDNETNILKYYNSISCFYFPMAGNGTIASAARGGGAISTFTKGVVSMQGKIASASSDGMLSMFLSNHDQDRSAGYLANDNYKKMAASLYLLTPGTPVIYYGEEIGLKGSGDSPEDANRRLPFKWGDIWTCEISSKATYSIDLWTDTADDQRRDEDSLLNHYINVLKIRHSYPAIARGTYSAVYGGKATFGGFYITHENDHLIILHNTSATETVTVNLNSLEGLSDKNLSMYEVLDYLGISEASVEGTTLTLGPQTTVILH